MKILADHYNAIDHVRTCPVAKEIAPSMINKVRLLQIFRPAMLIVLGWSTAEAQIIFKAGTP